MPLTENLTTKVASKDDNTLNKPLQFLSEDEKQLNVVLGGFTYSRSFYSYRYLKFRQWMRNYHRIPDTKPPFRSNLFIPLTYSTINTILPRLVANNPTFRYEPRKESDQEAIDQMSSLVKYQLDRMDFFKKLKMWVKDCLQFGTGVIKVYWHRDDKEDINDADMEVVDMFDFFPDPKATQIDGGDYVVHRTIVPLSTLKTAKGPAGKPLYKNLEKIKDTTSEENTNKLFLTNDRQMTIGDIDARLVLGTPYRQSMTKQVEVLEYWGIYGDDDDEWVIAVANRNTVIRAEKNPYPKGKRPFVKFDIDPNNFLFFGTGVADVLEHLQTQLNDIRNQRLDNVNLILNKLFVVLKDADVNEQELISRPGGVIYEGTPGGVRVLETPDVTNSGYQEEALVRQDAQEAAGISDIINGQLQDAAGPIKSQTVNTTARGAQMAVEQAGSRFKYYMQNLEDALRAFGQKLYEYNQEFISEEKVIRVEAENNYEAIQKQGLLNTLKKKIGLPVPQPSQFKFIKIRPDAIRNLDLDVKVESGSTQPVEDTLKQQKAMQFISIMASLPVTTPETYMALAEEVIDAFKIPHKDKIMKTLQPPQGAPKASVSVSLKGDLNDFQSAEIARQVGASQQSTDPQLVAILDAKNQANELQTKLIEHGAKGAVESRLLKEQAAINQQNGNQPGGQNQVS